MKFKNANVFEHTFLIRKAATQNFSCNLLLLSCSERFEHIVVMLAGLSKNHTGEIIFSNFVSCEFMHRYSMLVNFGGNPFSSSSSEEC